MIMESEPMRTGPSVKRGKSRQDYATPPDFMESLYKRFGPISFDLAASGENYKHPAYFTEAEDSLSQDWSKLRGQLFLNPPFDNIAPWARKCADTSMAKVLSLGIKIFFLVPASVGSNWFAAYVHKRALVLALNGRIHFDPTNPTWGYPKDCMLCVYGELPGFDVWRWK